MAQASSNINQLCFSGQALFPPAPVPSTDAFHKCTTSSSPACAVPPLPGSWWRCRAGGGGLSPNLGTQRTSLGPSSQASGGAGVEKSPSGAGHPVQVRMGVISKHHPSSAASSLQRSVGTESSCGPLPTRQPFSHSFPTNWL